MKYWLGVVSENHVKRGVQDGIAQVCHGKKAPLARMKKDDWLIYYSPKTSRENGALLQCFTAIGQIADDTIYQYEMSKTFCPYRRKVIYEDCSPISINALKDKLDLRQEKNWGDKLRFGLIELSQTDFQAIKEAMDCDNSLKHQI
ncbi:EVE domain-containing protein [Oleidesulfovibrio sp.]|uniref:EVE domain-containing protein n=1 Tax=Oleidesulfovibrio sp. TaxID=2909707 RepID=UPI003A88DC1B